MSLSNINPAIVRDVATRISETSLESLNDRKDKFISNVYKTKIDLKILKKKPEASATDKQKKNVQALQNKSNFNSTGKQDNQEECSNGSLYWCDGC